MEEDVCRDGVSKPDMDAIARMIRRMSKKHRRGGHYLGATVKGPSGQRYHLALDGDTGRVTWERSPER